MSRLTHPAALLAPLLLLGGTWSCAQPVQRTSAVLEAPVPSPPGTASPMIRIRYWEDRLPVLGRADQSEAHLCLGELYLEVQDAPAARLHFYTARSGEVSLREQAQASFGIGRSYLLQDQPRMAERHLAEAAKNLDGPEGEECDYLLAFAKGGSLPGVDAALVARTAAYTGGAGTTPSTRPNGSTSKGAYASVQRRDWGARAMLANFDPMEKPWRLTVHHTAEPAATYKLDASYREMRDLQRMHQTGNGWADLGYHFLIDQAGRVIEGRPMSAQGAHAGDFDRNRGNIGICLIGNFVAQPDRGDEYALAQSPSREQMVALESLVASLRRDYSIPATQVWGHQDFKGTACPGPFLQGWVERLNPNLQ